MGKEGRRLGVDRKEGFREEYVRDQDGCWVKNRKGEQGKRYLERWRHYGVSEKLDTREITRNPQE